MEVELDGELDPGFCEIELGELMLHLCFTVQHERDVWEASDSERIGRPTYQDDSPNYWWDGGDLGYRAERRWEWRNKKESGEKFEVMPK
jgi:hypothetical protein